MEYITIERSVYDAMVSTLVTCQNVLTGALSRLSHKSRDEWIDSYSAQGILRKSSRSMQTMRSSGKIGYSLIGGCVYYPANEIGRLIDNSYVDAGKI